MAEIQTTSATLQADAAPDHVSATVEALARALELHDYQRSEFGETAGHASRVTRLALLLAERTTPELLHDPQLAFGFRLHDIGMIGVRSSTLLKLGPLDPTEIDEIREHPWLGERIVAPVPSLNGLAREVIACHHERWDGSGYPDAMRGEDIPIEARVVALADVFDALISERPYKPAWKHEDAVAYVQENSGSLFDPACVEALFRDMAQVRIIEQTRMVVPPHLTD